MTPTSLFQFRPFFQNAGFPFLWLFYPSILATSSKVLLHDKKGSWRSGEEGLEWLGIRICMRKRVRKRGKERESERMEKGDSEQREQRRL